MTATFRVAALQAAPVFLDREASVAKLCDLIAEAGKQGVKVAVFPEAFIPAYPDWVWCLAPRERAQLNALYGELVANAVEIPGPEVGHIADAARRAKMIVIGGVSERNREASGTSLFNTAIVIGADGQLLARHRKLMATGAERLVWAAGDGSTLRVHETPLGRIGALICWENYMPLARFTLYAGGAQIHAAPTWDRGEPWIATLRHIAREGRMFVIGCCQALHRDAIPDRYAFKSLYPADRQWINAGDSAIVNPDGQILAGPLHDQEGILTAEVDPALTAAGRWMFDAAGHYSRPDLFRLTVFTEPQRIVREEERDPAGAG